LLGCVSLPAGKPFSACATKLGARKETDGAAFIAKLRFPAVLVKQEGQWQLAAPQSSAVKVPQHSPN
jgi:hypothetical protein